jgi:hypothetical protein
LELFVFAGARKKMGATADKGGANLPSEFSPWTFLKTVSLERGGGPRIGADSDEIITGVESDQGYYLWQVTVPK